MLKLEINRNKVDMEFSGTQPELMAEMTLGVLKLVDTLSNKDEMTWLTLLYTMATALVREACDKESDSNTAKEGDVND